MNKPIRIVLVDSRALVRHGLRHMLESEADMEVVGDYASAEEILFEMVRLRCDIVIMGTQMSGINWLEATRSLKRSGLYSGVDVIILAESGHYQAEALEAGAASYLLKDVTSVELTQAIRQAYRDRHSSKECAGLVEEAIELVIPPPANAAQLLRFMSRLAETLQDDFASIVCTVGSWDRGTSITIRPHAATPSSLVVTLAQIAEVEKVEQAPTAGGVFTSFQQKFGFLPRSGISPGQRIRVILQETDVASPQLHNTLN